jgi:hypothetical protein
VLELPQKQNIHRKMYEMLININSRGFSSLPRQRPRGVVESRVELSTRTLLGTGVQLPSKDHQALCTANKPQTYTNV